MSTVLKLIMKIFKFMWKKLGVAGALFIVILFVVPIGVAMFDDASDDYIYAVQWEIEGTSIEQVEMTEDKTMLFSSYELEENYGKIHMYQVEVMVTNTGVNPIYINRDFNLIHMEDEDNISRYGEVWEYYYEMDDYDRLNTSVIASGRTMPVNFVFVFNEVDMPKTLYFYDKYEGEEIFSIDVPAPVNMD